jgi:hypothetical protein
VLHASRERSWALLSAMSSHAAAGRFDMPGEGIWILEVQLGDVSYAVELHAVELLTQC